jgi:hypothetical protein
MALMEGLSYDAELQTGQYFATINHVVPICADPGAL